MESRCGSGGCPGEWADTMTATAARAFQVREPGVGELVDVTLPVPSADDVLVRTHYSGISRGTERLVFNGRVPASEHERMRAPFQRGDFPAPVIYGYSNVGVVEQGPTAWVGQRVFCLYPHQSVYVVPVASVIALPSDLPPARAVLAANMETAINALWDGAPRIGDRISVIGGGTLGCLVAALCSRVAGTDVQLIDTDPARADVARALDVAFRAPADADTDRDLVFHASATQPGLRQALAVAGNEALVLELSWYGDTEVQLPLGAAFHARRLTLRSSQVGQIAPAAARRRSHAERLALALDLLRDPVFDRLIDGDSAFHELPATMAAIAAGGQGVLCHRVHYHDP